MNLFDDYPTSEDTSWNWYYCSILDELTTQIVEEPWPVFANSFDAAMDIYQLIMNIKYNKQ